MNTNRLLIAGNIAWALASLALLLWIVAGTNTTSDRQGEGTLEVKIVEMERDLAELRIQLDRRENDQVDQAALANVAEELAHLRTTIRQATEIREGRRHRFPGDISPDRVAFSVQSQLEKLENRR